MKYSGSVLFCLSGFFNETGIVLTTIVKNLKYICISPLSFLSVHFFLSPPWLKKTLKQIPFFLIPICFHYAILLKYLVTDSYKPTKNHLALEIQEMMKSFFSQELTI